MPPEEPDKMLLQNVRPQICGDHVRPNSFNSPRPDPESGKSHAMDKLTSHEPKNRYDFSCREKPSVKMNIRHLLQMCDCIQSWVDFDTLCRP